MGLNKEYIDLPVINYNQSEQHIDLEAGVSMEKLLFELTGNIEVVDASPAGDGVVNNEPLQRLIDSLEIDWDGRKPIKDIALRDLYQEFLMNVQNEPAQTEPVDTDLDAQGTTDFSLRFEYYFAKRYMIRPFEFGHFPPIRVKNPLRLKVRWNKDTTNSSSGAGTGAIVASGSDEYQINDVQLKVTQVVAPRTTGVERLPMMLPFLETHRAETFDTATEELVFRIPDDRNIVAAIIRQTVDTDNDPEDFINDLTFKARGRDWLDELNATIFRAEQAGLFPALGTERTGYLHLLHADGGLLTNRVVPADRTDLRWIFDVATPSSGDGKIDLTFVYALAFGPPVTKGIPGGNR